VQRSRRRNSSIRGEAREPGVEELDAVQESLEPEVLQFYYLKHRVRDPLLLNWFFLGSEYGRIKTSLWDQRGVLVDG